MLFWMVILGVYMGWVEAVYAKRDSDPPPDPPDDSPDSPPEIPLFLRRPSTIPVLEPDDTPLLADACLRAGGGG